MVFEVEKMNIHEILGTLLVITGIFDALKYTVQAHKIRKAKSASNMSRKFTNWAIANDIVKLSYAILIKDLYITISSILALICMLQLWYETYLWYPYRYRNLKNFKRPNILVYLFNSVLPNRIRRHL